MVYTRIQRVSTGDNCYTDKREVNLLQNKIKTKPASSQLPLSELSPQSEVPEGWIDPVVRRIREKASLVEAKETAIFGNEPKDEKLDQQEVQSSKTFNKENINSKHVEANTELNKERGVQVAIGPGPFNPPGNQPINFYIGTEASKSIATNYALFHPGDTVLSNFIPISTILPYFQLLGQNVNVTNLTKEERGLKPDIVNVNRTHLYEIKPFRQQALALTEALFYISLFNKAGVNINLGPSNEPGTFGAIAAPGGYYLFASPQPGVIVYRYRRGTYQVNQANAPQPSSPQDFLDQMSRITGLTGAALIIYLIFSVGSRVFPPRNLVPVP